MLALVAMSVATASVLSSSQQPQVWPLPTTWRALPGAPVALAPGQLKIVPAGPGAASDVLTAGISRYSGAGGLIFSWPNGSTSVEPGTADALAADFVVTVHVGSADETLEVGSCGHADPTIRCTDESYSLNITASGASIVAPRVYGALYALETFAQLVEHTVGVPTPYTVYATCVCRFCM